MNPTRSKTSGNRSGSAATHGGSRPRGRGQTPAGFEQRLLARARDAEFTIHDRIIVGFSGGRDSLSLAAALRWTQTSLGMDVLLVHVDHHLRASSSEEAKLAANLAIALGMEFQVIAVSPPLNDIHPGVGVEEAARRERYRILFDAASQIGARVVATAHHEGDQAETVMLHLLRGGGVHGAAAMAERSPSPVSQPSPLHDISLQCNVTQAWLWRPLLHEPRKVIDAYVQSLGLEPIEDPSNADTTIRRNALRQAVIPTLEAYFPGATSALARYASLAAEDDRALGDLAVTTLAHAVDPGGRLATDRLRAEPLAIQRRVIRRWLAEVTGSGALTAERTDAVLAFAQAGSGGKALEIGEGWEVRLERGMLRVNRGMDSSGNQPGEAQ